MRFSTIIMVWSLKSLSEFIRSFLFISLRSEQLKIWFCQFARRLSLFLCFLLSAIAPEIKVRSRAKSDWAISKGNVTSSGIHTVLYSIGNIIIIYSYLIIISYMNPLEVVLCIYLQKRYSLYMQLILNLSLKTLYTYIMQNKCILNSLYITICTLVYRMIQGTFLFTLRYRAVVLCTLKLF